VPSSIVLSRVSARRWIARIMISWGLIAPAMLFVRTPIQFYSLRFLLGAAEAGFFPGIIYYLSPWLPTHARARAIVLAAVAIPLSGAIGSSLSASLLGLAGVLGLAGWQWLFLLEGILSVLLGLATLALLTNSPADARWLSEPQRVWLVGRMRSDQRESGAPHGMPPLRALVQPLLWLVAMPFLVAGGLGLAALGCVCAAVLGLVAAAPCVVLRRRVACAAPARVRRTRAPLTPPGRLA
jgi:ACS family tartrate transporter-like MFS transporter